MEQFKRRWHSTPGSLRKPLVLIFGTLVLFLGLLGLLLPILPGWVLIFVALAIFATEFDKAEQLRDWLIRRFKDAARQVRQRRR